MDESGVTTERDTGSAMSNRSSGPGMGLVASVLLSMAAMTGAALAAQSEMPFTPHFATTWQARSLGRSRRIQMEAVLSNIWRRATRTSEGCSRGLKAVSCRAGLAIRLRRRTGSKPPDSLYSSPTSTMTSTAARSSLDSSAAYWRSRVLIQNNYDSASRVLCRAVRMNKAAYSALPDACTSGSSGAYGSDRISKFAYNDLDLVVTEQRGVGTFASADVYQERLDRAAAQVSDRCKWQQDGAELRQLRSTRATNLSLQVRCRRAGRRRLRILHL